MRVSGFGFSVDSVFSVFSVRNFFSRFLFPSRRFVYFLAPIVAASFCGVYGTKDRADSGKMDGWKCPSHSLLTVIGCLLSVIRFRL